MLRAACAATSAALLLAGCGGSSDRHPATRSAATERDAAGGEAAREAKQRSQVPGTRLSAADRVAYYQIATTSGLLRARASTVLSGLRGTPRATLQAGRERLAQLRPDSTALTALRGELAAAIDALLRHETQAAARTAMRATTALNADLTRFSKGKAVRLLLPD